MLSGYVAIAYWSIMTLLTALIVAIMLIIRYGMGLDMSRLKLIIRGGDCMRAVYVALIVNGRMTIDNVAKSLREVVLADLAALGLDGNGKPVDAE